MHIKKYENGFTLVELSIVLVIVGLITAGVFVGRDLIEAAKVRSVVSQFNQVKTATGTFISKYQGLPGDLPKANFYGLVIAGSDCTDANSDGIPDSAAPPNPNDLGCGGNGDGVIDGDTVDDRNKFTFEVRNFWSHLSSAGFYALDATGENTPGGGFPETALTGIGVHVIADTSVTTDINYYHIGGVALTTWELYMGNYTNKQVLTPSMANSIDVMLDDGVPNRGGVEARWGAQAQLSATTTATAGNQGCVFNNNVYNTLYDEPACQLRINLDY